MVNNDILRSDADQGNTDGLGESMTTGRLRGLGVKATRDPIVASLRQMGYLTQRRPYSVPGPNSLWHLGECVYVCALFRPQILFALV